MDDVVCVCLGEKIFVDGEVIEGYIVIDEFMLMGEFMFVEKVVGDMVVVGIINKIGFILFKVICVGKDMVLV